MPRKSPLRQRLAAFRASLSDAIASLTGAGGGAATFTGAQSGRLTFDWALAPMSADREIYGNVGKLKARGRELVRNNAHAAHAMRLYADNIVGPNGVTLQCRVKNNRKKLETDLNNSVESAWKDFGRAQHCSVNGRHSWVDIQRYVMQLVPSEGEAIIRIVEHGQAPYGLSLQMLDSDLLDEEFNQPPGDNRNEIRMSVEIDARERPVAYHFLEQHPNGLLRVAVNDRKRVRIPAAQIIHLYRTARLGQTRGVSWFAPVMYCLRMLGAYQEAEVVAARIGASKVGILTTDAAAYGPPLGEEPAASPQAIDIEPGSIWQPLPGQHMESWDPQHPNAGYNDFVQGMLQSIAAGLGLSYASLSGDLSGASYSSGRTGLLQERDHYRALQGWLVDYMHARVFERWLAWAVLMGRFEMGQQEKIAAAIAWQPRGWSWVDPGKDAAASETEIANGLNSRSRILAEQGQDYEEVLAELKAEQEMADEAGVSIVPATPGTPPPSDPAAEAPPAKPKKKAA